MFCKQHNIIFLHVPKTGGTSFGAWLECGIVSPHNSARRIANEIANGQHADWFSFAVVRHPLDRLASVFRYYCDGGNGRHKDAAIGSALSGMGFRRFVLSLPSLRETLPYYHEAEHHVGAQSVFTHRAGGDMFLDHVGRFERLHRTIDLLRELTGIQKPFPHLNASTREKTDWREMYDAETERFARDYYEADMRLFGYD